MRIAIDIDSTLHHYWDELAEAAKRRFGVDLPYEGQHTWKITRLRDEQLRAAIADTHSDEVIARAEPYPHAVGIINAWHDAGHWIHVTSHRAERCHPATESWLAAIGLVYDDLHCSHDKVSRCVDLEIDVIIDDSPVTLLRAIDEGMVAATLVHPWNRDLCEEELEVVSAEDWPGLAAALEARVPRLGRQVA
jgi:beta-phosphoglucomutase-like phosphatase (HAD superfamily)